MDQKSIVLAALAAGSGATHTPVQAQKLLFLIDQKIPELIGGKQFNFQPYHYGPFDKDVYNALEKLRAEELVESVPEPGLRWNYYRPTEAGLTKGRLVLEAVDPKARDFISRASEFVRKLPFEDLVVSIYKAYPEMKVNSVFKG